MQLIVMRHGEASWDAPSDRERQLTARGELCARNAGRYLARERWQPDLWLSSPYARAAQTARCVAESFAAAEINEIDTFAPNNSPADVAAALNVAAADRVILFSHQPLVGRFLGWLLHDDPQQQPPMDTASMCCVQFDGCVAGAAELLWHLHAAAYSEAL